MKVCVVGSGAREHALASALANTADEVFVCPGNGGISYRESLKDKHTIFCVNKNPLEIEADLYVIGPEAPLWEGLADELRSNDKLVVGPGKDGAKLEASKAWMKELLYEFRIPTADFKVFSEIDKATKFLESLEPPYVIKTDGLAAGKGVLVTHDLDEAIEDARKKLSGQAFGKAGEKIVIEKGLIGEELSIMALCDSKRVQFFGSAKDYKRLKDNDKGPNTGGMGAYSPVSHLTSVVDKAMDLCLEPLVWGLNKREIDYRGIIYAGLMIVENEPYVLEYNVRLGDPEAQVILPRVDEDLVAVFLNVAKGSFKGEVKFTNEFVVGVVAASKGYPEDVVTGDVIYGCEEALSVPGCEIYFAGVNQKDGQITTAGGRVLTVIAKNEDPILARSSAYKALESIQFDGMHYRKDIFNQANELIR